MLSFGATRLIGCLVTGIKGSGESNANYAMITSLKFKGPGELQSFKAFPSSSRQQAASCCAPILSTVLVVSGLTSYEIGRGCCHDVSRGYFVG